MHVSEICLNYLLIYIILHQHADLMPSTI